MWHIGYFFFGGGDGGKVCALKTMRNRHSRKSTTLYICTTHSYMHCKMYRKVKDNKVWLNVLDYVQCTDYMSMNKHLRLAEICFSLQGRKPLISISLFYSQPRDTGVSD